MKAQYLAQILSLEWPFRASRGLLLVCGIHTGPSCWISQGLWNQGSHLVSPEPQFPCAWTESTSFLNCGTSVLSPAYRMKESLVRGVSGPGCWAA